MTSKAETYQAYLLRFWRQEETRPWRVTIQRVGNEQHYHFASVDEAITFVLDQLDWEERAVSGLASEMPVGPKDAPA